MHNRVYINTIALLFTTLFILLRVGNVHGLSHLTEDDDTIMHCELCDMLLKVEHQVPLDIPQDVQFSLSTAFIKLKEIPQTIYTAPVHCYVLPDFVFNKPPPIA